MTTFAQAKQKLANDLRDPDKKVFSDSVCGDLITDGLIEVGRIAPRRFQEDLDPVENQFEYQLLTAEFASAQPEVEVMRVELWDSTTTPQRPITVLAPVSGEYANASNAGWLNDDGTLEVPYDVVRFIGANPSNYLYRVWGYAPYAIPTDDADAMPVSAEREMAVREYARLLALQALVYERDLFTQWQTRPGNTDITPASLLSGLAAAEDRWRRRSGRLQVLRDMPG